MHRNFLPLVLSQEKKNKNSHHHQKKPQTKKQTTPTTKTPTTKKHPQENKTSNNRKTPKTKTNLKTYITPQIPQANLTFSLSSKFNHKKNLIKIWFSAMFTKKRPWVCE